MSLDKTRNDDIVFESSVDGLNAPARAFVDVADCEYAAVANRDSVA
jgi:hypothetical protein